MKKLMLTDLFILFTTSVQAQTLTVTPLSVSASQQVTVSWDGIPSPTYRDWVGLYPVGAPDSQIGTWLYVNCSSVPTVAVATGQCAFTLPTAGDYEFRLFANNTTAVRLAVSNTVTVTVPPPSTPTCGPVTISGAGRIPSSLTNNFTLTPLGANGRFYKHGEGFPYTVPEGWDFYLTDMLFMQKSVYAQTPNYLLLELGTGTYQTGDGVYILTGDRSPFSLRTPIIIPGGETITGRFSNNTNYPTIFMIAMLQGVLVDSPACWQQWKP